MEKIDQGMITSIEQIDSIFQKEKPQHAAQYITVDRATNRTIRICHRCGEIQEFDTKNSDKWALTNPAREPICSGVWPQRSTFACADSDLVELQSVLFATPLPDDWDFPFLLADKNGHEYVVFQTMRRPATPTESALYRTKSKQEVTV